MKRFFAASIFIFSFGNADARQSLFAAYTDSAQLVADANALVSQFVADVKALRPGINLQPKAILNTKPFLIFYDGKTNTVNLPIWYQVIPPQQQFFAELAGSGEEGKKVFGMLFNGFYLPHELGHALQVAAKKDRLDHYGHEYFANTIAVLYWRKAGKQQELQQSYEYAKKFLKQLKNPVPDGQDEQAYLNEHYNEIAQDPYKYGYYEFSQLVKIYEDSSLPGFDDFVTAFLQ